MRYMFIAAVSAALLAHAAPQADYVEGEQSCVLVTPELQAAAKMMFGAEGASNILHAARLQMLKYDADMATEAGRRAWHGRLVREEIHTNDLAKIQVYSNTVDGTTWRYRMSFKPKAAVVPGRRRTTYTTNGIPARLAAARAARAAQIDDGPSVTNIHTVANAPKGN